MNKIYASTKTYTHSQGLSCAFRQWRATHSHCQLIHGYAIQVSFEFGCKDLDDKNWAVDFGGLSELKDWLKHTFDHTMCVAADDPELEMFEEMEKRGIIHLRVFEHGVGCERFAEYAFDKAQEILENKYGDRCWVNKAEVREHEGNSAIVRRGVDSLDSPAQ